MLCRSAFPISDRELTINIFEEISEMEVGDEVARETEKKEQMSFTCRRTVPPLAKVGLITGFDRDFTFASLLP